MFIVPGDQADHIRQYLINQRETIAIAESVTAGLLQQALSTIPDASKFWQGGITAFNVAQKFKHLRVEPLHALSVNCVSGKVAQEMALHVCELFLSQWGIGITGYVTPAPGWGNKVFAHFAIAYKSQIIVAEEITPSQDWEPTVIQQFYAQTVIDAWIIQLKKLQHGSA